MKNFVKLRGESKVITKGTTPTTLGKDFVKKGIPFLRAQNIINGKILIDSDILFIDEVTHNNDLKRSQIQNGDLLLTIAGTIGRTAIVKNNLNGLNCNQAVAIIRLDSDKVDLQYLKRFIESESAQRQFSKSKVTSIISNLSLDLVGRLKIPLFPIENQKKIAAILDTADIYRHKTRALVEKYDQLAQSHFLEMFGDPVLNEKGWKKRYLMDLTSKIGSGATPNGGKESYEKEGISLIRSMNVYDVEFKYKDLAFLNQNQADKLKNVIVENNDVLFNITGASVCRSCIVPSNILPARVNQHVAILRSKVKQLSPVFLNRLLISEKCKKQLLGIGKQGGATREAITKEQLENFEIILPPISLQNQFASNIQLIEAQKQQALATLQKAETLFNSLLQRAFKGELVS